jgi:outer membrane biosynthesis protein TonB
MITKEKKRKKERKKERKRKRKERKLKKRKEKKRKEKKRKEKKAEKSPETTGKYTTVATQTTKRESLDSGVAYGKVYFGHRQPWLCLLFYSSVPRDVGSTEGFSNLEQGHSKLPILNAYSPATVVMSPGAWLGAEKSQHSFQLPPT